MYLYVSMYCSVTCLGFLSQVLGEGDISYAFGVLDFSHEEVKRVVGLFIGFVFAIASAHTVFCTLKQGINENKKKKKKKRKTTKR